MKLTRSGFLGDGTAMRRRRRRLAGALAIASLLPQIHDRVGAATSPSGGEYTSPTYVFTDESSVAMTLFGSADQFAEAVPDYDALVAGLVIRGTTPPVIAPTTATPTGPAPETTAAAGPPATTATTSTASGDEAPPPDLAAMSLVPADLEDAGLPDHGWSNGVITSETEAVAEFFSFWRSDTDVTIIDEGLAAAAPSQMYALQFGRPTTEGDASNFEERVVAYVISFDDEAAAAAGFAAWAATWQAEYPSVSTDAAVGEESFAVAGEATHSEPHGGGPFPFVHLGFRTGAIVAGVSVDFFTGYAPEVETAAALAATQHERIAAVVAGGAPDLSGRILSFDVPGTQWTTAMYGIRDGQYLFRDRDTDASAADSQATATAAGVIDQFQVEQQLSGEPGGRTPPLALYTARIVTFPDAATASTYIADSVDRLTEGGAEDVKPVEAPADAGEEVAAYTYAHERDDGVRFNDYRVYARTGSTVFTFAINTTGQVDLDAVAKITRLQASCLDGTTSCAASFPVPL